MNASLAAGTQAGRPDGARLLAQLSTGDERAFADLVERFSPGMLRLAMVYVPARAAAEEVVRDAWLGVIDGIRRSNAPLTLKTWIFGILMHTARVRAARDGRFLPPPAFAGAAAEAEPEVEPDRLVDRAHPTFAGQWAVLPRSFDEIPEERLAAPETRKVIERTLTALPPAEGAVVVLRDIQGFRCEEVCELLQISESDQRALLHRARTKVRAAIERYLGAS